MPGRSNGGRNGGRGRGSHQYDNNRKSNSSTINESGAGADGLIDSLREACPPHKQKDLEKLIETMRGDEGKIRQRIQEWWEGPDPGEPVEEEWADVNKRGGKKNRDNFNIHQKQGYNGSGGAHRGGGRSEGRGGRARGRVGRGRGRGGRGTHLSGGTAKNQQQVHQTNTPLKSDKSDEDQNNPPVGSVRVTNVTKDGPPQEVSFSLPAMVEMPNSQSSTAMPEVTPSTMPTPLVGPPPVPTNKAVGSRSSAPHTGNVWATKGSAHLIQAEKPKPPAPAPVAVTTPAPALKQTSTGLVGAGTTLLETAASRPPASSKHQSQQKPALSTISNVGAVPENNSVLKEINKQPASTPLPVTNEMLPVYPKTKEALPPRVAEPLIPSAHDEVSTDVLKDVAKPAVEISPTTTNGLAVGATVSSTASTASPASALPLETGMDSSTDEWGQGRTPSVPEPANTTTTFDMTPQPSTAADTMPVSKPVESEPNKSSVAATKDVPKQNTTPSVPPPVGPRTKAAPSTRAIPATSFLNMGHWETGDVDDTNLDFGFGSFGTDNEVVSMDATTTSSSTNNVASSSPIAAPPASSNAVPSTTKDNSGPQQPSASAPSPARPPPGLSIGGMPPMPANAVLVHELENKLEEASLAAAAAAAPNAGENSMTSSNNAGAAATKPPSSNMPPAAASVPGHDTIPSSGIVPGPANTLAAPAAASLHHPAYTSLAAGNPYGAAMGMYTPYSANAAGNAFVGGIPGSAPLLGTGVMPPPQMSKQQQQQLPPIPPGSLYGQQQQPQSTLGSSSAVSSTNNANNNSSSGSETASASTGPVSAMPPGMQQQPGMPSPYGNPALYHYGQQPPFHLSAHQGNPAAAAAAAIGYNYGYTAAAQFGGAVQAGGFGYNTHPSMAQSAAAAGGYGHYEDNPIGALGPHSIAGSGASGSGGGYQPKNSGGGSSGVGYRSGGNSGSTSSSNTSGRNSANQYPQNQYGAYGGQPPYGMGYHGDHHFGQRAATAYGGTIQDIYGMQQQQQQQQQQPGAGSYGFDDHQDQYNKGRKSNRGGGGLHHHFPQHGPPPHQFGVGQQQQQQQHQQSIGDSNTHNSSVGWSQGGGASSGGWMGGTPSWQNHK